MTWTVVGQDAAVALLSNAVQGDRGAHAYLFAGPGHVGKTLTALQFAQALNCTGEAPPCGRCRPCERIAAGNHADVEIVYPGGPCDEGDHDHKPGDSRDIRVCQVRRLERTISRAPFEGRCRVQVIEPADALNQIGQNALLKTLEEPPPNVVLVLITEHEDALLETIRSRVRRVPFVGMSRGEIERTLRTRRDVEPERAAALARLSGGRLGWAILALHDERMMQAREEALARAEELAGASLAQRFAFAAELGGRYTKDRAAVQASLEMWQEWWRDILLIAAGRPEGVMHRDRLDRLHALAAQCDTVTAAHALRAVSDARQQLDENASPVLALEVMMLALPEMRPNAVASRLAAARTEGGAAHGAPSPR
jgi:DNA polymerase-3 subunit delta'